MSEVTTDPQWYVQDYRASEMARLGWTGEPIDRILITSKTAEEICECKGEDCVVARIEFANREGKLGESNLRDAYLLAAAPRLKREMERFLVILERAESLPNIWNFLTKGTGIATANSYRYALANSEPPTA